MKSILLKRALRQRFGIKNGWGTVCVPLTGDESEEEE